METLNFTINNLWMMIAAVLVFAMHMGFTSLEAGLTRSKNTVNIVFKNVMIIAIGILTYTFIGFSLMYPGESFAGGFIGFAGFGLNPPPEGMTAEYDEGFTYWTDFIFQAMFAATAATIVSGAVAERIKLFSFLTFSLIYVSVCYPLVGMWTWGGGFLDGLETPFYDFAGSTIVHSVGGWAALAGAIVLGPRLGKYISGKIRPIPGHNLPLAVIGVFLLWFGWYGFNGGSVLTADAETVSRVFVTTSIAAAAGAVGAYFLSFILFKSHDLTMVLNGVLGGLVGITAGADLMSPMSAALIGVIGGFLVVLAIVFFDRVKVDDPVGAISVHLVCGIWGTLAVAFFGTEAGLSQLKSQVIGITAVGIFCFASSLILFYIIKFTIGLRVTEHEETEGLDITEHGMHAYPDFTIK